ncbi:F510_1955 family glycosylhydrolase [Paenisporosarcina sp. TG20]|uniref:F510_1955 family glycosylhydrolase n=1 Tax=Paenisporosarcina sp. TG20 TaxID=1211706 RepID=UPI0002E04B8A|nr:hypothetical protein [Paenisporosarcina sp. TG20]
MKLTSLFTSLIILLYTVPVRVFAHGTEAEHSQETAGNGLVTNGIIISLVLLVLGVITWLLLKNLLKKVNVKNQEGRSKRDRLKKWLRISQWISAVSLLLLFTTGTFSAINGDGKENEVELMDIHGLGITNEDSEIYIPAHDGLKVFKGGIWSSTEGGKHDYMGFSMVDDGFYSSGHPGAGSSLKNPFGVVKTTDMGQTLEMLDLYQEVDFHGMAVGYNTHAIYVMNPQANSRMDEAGLYYSTDDTKTWTRSDMTGLQGPIYTIAVHPTNEAIVALGTGEGVFLSNDFGQSFNSVSDSPTTAVAFSAKGELIAGSTSDEMTLTKFVSETKEPILLSIPSLSEGNTISYIAVNPQNEKQITFATAEKDIYLTEDSGQNWNLIADKGQGINLKSETE